MPEKLITYRLIHDKHCVKSHIRKFPSDHSGNDRDFCRPSDGGNGRAAWLGPVIAIRVDDPLAHTDVQQPTGLP